MPRFRLLFSHISTLLVLFLTTVITVVSNGLPSASAIDLSSAAMPAKAIGQRITSPGLTTPINKPTTSPTPTSAPLPNPSESPLPIPVPLPKKSLPGSTAPSPPSSPSPKPQIPQTPINHTGRFLTVGERDKIANYLRSRNLSISPIVNPPADPRFILHDTSMLMPANLLERERQLGRGPLGLGVNAYLPREVAAVIARPNFYESRRPTTTEFEKASDVMGLVDRERLFRQVWQATTSDARRQALDSALARLDLSGSEIAKEQKEAQSKLSATSGRIYTAGTWTIEAICNRYNNGEESIGSTSLGNACDRLDRYFTTRNSRVRSSVAAEIVQIGARSEQGNQNTCDPRNSNIATLPNPPYSDNQYDRILAIYLRAAMAAGKFPQMTTHFALDTFDPSAHCDPRCFNLTKLYNSIATTMGHARGSTYGITPSYGTNLGPNNIWWNDRICHSSAP